MVESLNASGDEASSIASEEEEMEDANVLNKSLGEDDIASDAHEVSSVDSDMEKENIATSAIKYARNCIVGGNYRKAMTALIKVTETYGNSLSTRKASLLALQILLVNGLFDQAVVMALELYSTMPSPYMLEDGYLLVALVYDRSARHRFTRYWSKKMTDLNGSTLRQFGSRAFKQQDYILCSYAFAKAKEIDVFPEAGSFKNLYQCFVSTLRYTDPLTDDAFRKQLTAWQIAYKATILMRWPSRWKDRYYIKLRELFVVEFPTLYDEFFLSEDKLRRVLGRCWKRWRKQKQLQNALKTSVNVEQGSKLSPMSPKAATFHRPNGTTGPLVKDKLKRVKTSCVYGNASNGSSPSKVRLATIKEGTRRYSVKQQPVRKKILMSESQTLCKQEEPCLSVSAAKQTTVNSLLDIYPFEGNQDRTMKADINLDSTSDTTDLNQVQEFARMVHYRSKVIQKRHHAVDFLNETTTQPLWLKQLNVAFNLLSKDQTKTMDSSSFHPHLAKIHYRFTSELAAVLQTYKKKFPESLFTQRLRSLLRSLHSWQYTSFSDLISDLEGIRACGVAEEEARNLEFYHIQTQTK